MEEAGAWGTGSQELVSKPSSFAVPALHSHVHSLPQTGRILFFFFMLILVTSRRSIHSLISEVIPFCHPSSPLSGPHYSSPNCTSVGLTWLQMGPQGESGQPLGQVHLLPLLTFPLHPKYCVSLKTLPELPQDPASGGYEGLVPILIWGLEGSSWQSHIKSDIDVPRGRWHSQFSLSPASYSWLSLTLAQL